MRVNTNKPSENKVETHSLDRDYCSTNLKRIIEDEGGLVSFSVKYADLLGNGNPDKALSIAQQICLKRVSPKQGAAVLYAIEHNLKYKTDDSE